MEYKTLFTPINIGSLQIKNRVVMAPMLMGFGTFDGTVTQQMSDYYEERAKGGTGLIITEITRVNDATGASAFAQLGMSHDYQIKSLAGMVERVHSHGAKLFVQLHHPGRQNMGLLMGTVPMCITMNRCFKGFSKLLYSVTPAGKVLMEKHIVPRVVAPSKCENVYFADSNTRALSHREVKGLIADFIDAAQRVQKSGADGVELHASHGYLIQQFLSPNTNKRTDEYGGSLENRMRFLTDIIAGIRERCGADFPLIVRLTVDECYDRVGKPGKGYALNEGVEMAKRLEAAGIDAIDVSSGGYDAFNYWLEPTSFECGWRKYMAQAVKNAVKIPVLAANLIRSPEQAEQQINDGVQDMISLGRPQIADPNWVSKIQQGNEADVKRCICCLYCIESMQNNAYIGSHGKCSVNPLVGREGESLPVDGDGRKVLIIGAGPGGMTAAEFAAKRGFDVTVVEKADRPGGQLLLAAAPPHKEKLGWCIEDMYNAAKKAGAKFMLSTEADRSFVEAFNPYAVIAATGGDSFIPKSIPGSDLPNVLTTTAVLNGTVSFKNKTVTVIGSGMTGLETAELLASKGNKVIIVEMADTVAPGTWMQHVDDILPRLRELGARIYIKTKLLSIEKSGINVENKKLNRFLPCDYTVLALGVKSENALFNALHGMSCKLFAVGDANTIGRIADATNSAYDAVTKL